MKVIKYVFRFIFIMCIVCIMPFNAILFLLLNNVTIKETIEEHLWFLKDLCNNLLKDIK